MTNNHKCGACGGSGMQPYGECGKTCREDGTFIFHGIDCALYPDDCPVCLGVGSFSDQMPISDAMADAE